MTEQECEDFVKEQNDILVVTEPQRIAMEIGSMWGFNKDIKELEEEIVASYDSSKSLVTKFLAACFNELIFLPCCILLDASNTSTISLSSCSCSLKELPLTFIVTSAFLPSTILAVLLAKTSPGWGFSTLASTTPKLEKQVVIKIAVAIIMRFNFFIFTKTPSYIVNV